MRPTTNTVNINNDFINYLYRKLPRINAVGVLWEIACARSTTANNTFLNTLIGVETTRLLAAVICCTDYG